MSGTGCLPTMIYRDGIRKYSTVKFAGYNHTEAACDGGIYDMTNLTGAIIRSLLPENPAIG